MRAASAAEIVMTPVPVFTLEYVSVKVATTPAAAGGPTNRSVPVGPIRRTISVAWAAETVIEVAAAAMAPVETPMIELDHFLPVVARPMRVPGEQEQVVAVIGVPGLGAVDPATARVVSREAAPRRMARPRAAGRGDAR